MPVGGTLVGVGGGLLVGGGLVVVGGGLLLGGLVVVGGAVLLGGALVVGLVDRVAVLAWVLGPLGVCRVGSGVVVPPADLSGKALAVAVRLTGIAACALLRGCLWWWVLLPAPGCGGELLPGGL